MQLAEVRDRTLCRASGLIAALGLPVAGPLCVALVGGGGKTTTLLQLAREYAALGLPVTVTTTTHIRPPVGLPLFAPPNARPGCPIAVAGVLQADGKLGPPCPPRQLRALVPSGGVLLAEADGSRGLPAKAPADWEPVLPPCADVVVGVLGLCALGQTIEKACHRPERAASLLGRGVRHRLTAADCAALLQSEQGQRKGVHCRYALVLNQADDPARLAEAQEILRWTGQLPVAVTHYIKPKQEETE